MTKKPNNFSIKQWPEGERPRENLIQFGAELLTDAELLAIRDTLIDCAGVLPEDHRHLRYIY